MKMPPGVWAKSGNAGSRQLSSGVIWRKAYATFGTDRVGTLVRGRFHPRQSPTDQEAGRPDNRTALVTVCQPDATTWPETITSALRGLGVLSALMAQTPEGSALAATGWTVAPCGNIVAGCRDCTSLTTLSLDASGAFRAVGTRERQRKQFPGGFRLCGSLFFRGSGHQTDKGPVPPLAKGAALSEGAVLSENTDAVSKRRSA
jgi:hypothetical protein